MGNAPVLLALLLLALPTMPSGLPMEAASPPVHSMDAAEEISTGLPLSAMSGNATYSVSGGAFIQNMGQLGNAGVLFYSTGPLSAYFSAGRVDYRLQPQNRAMARMPGEPAPPAGPAGVFGMHFEGGRDAVPRGIEPLPHYFNFFVGNDQARWKSFVPAFGAVVYDGVYDGIDIEFRPTGAGVKYQFTVHPGADPSAIRFRYDGADVRVNSEGLLLATRAGMARDAGLEVFQPGRGRNAGVEAEFSVEGNDVSFSLGPYDRDLPLVIDPAVSPAVNSSIVIGGSGDDHAAGMALDGADYSYVTGITLSADFPSTPGSFDNRSKIGATARYDVFVLKLAPGGKRIVWCTFLGSSGNDYSHGIAADDYGFCFVCGNCLDFDYPVTGFAFDGSYNGYGDVFVTKLNPAGSALVFSTFLGGEYVDHGYAIAIDAAQNVYLAGSTASMEFPTTEGAFCRSISAGTGLEDAFVAKLWANGSALAYSTFLGGGGVEQATAIAVDGPGRPTVVGRTDSPGFPVTGGAVNRSNRGMDAFVTRFDADGSSLNFSAMVGGHADELATSLALVGEDRVLVAGNTGSGDFPDTTAQYGPPGRNAFVFGLADNGSRLLFSRPLGGSGNDSASAVRVDGSGSVCIAGTTTSNDLPCTRMAAWRTPQGFSDAFILKLDAGARHILYASYIGGGSDDTAAALSLDSAGRAVLAGDTGSADFPVTNGTASQNGTGVFVLGLDMTCTPTAPVLRASAADLEVALDWTPPEVGAEGIIGYDIYRGSSPSGLQKFASMVGSALAARDRMVQNGKLYYYSVLAVNSSGEGAMSGHVSAMPGLAPSEPWGLAASTGPGEVRLSWNAPNRTFGMPVLGYTIYRWRNFVGESNAVLMDAVTTGYNDTHIQNDILYHYAVLAKNVIGAGPVSNPVQAIASSFPSAPLAFSADVLGRQVILGWKAPQNPGAFPVLHYNIYRRAEGDRQRLIGDTCATVFMTPRQGAGTYYFRVAAVSGFGVGYFTDEIAATIQNQLPAAVAAVEPPSGTSATQFNFTPNAADQDGIIANYSWWFGDGERAFKETPYHFYRSRGVYNVTLRVTDDDGGVVNSTTTVVIFNTAPKITGPEPPGDVTLEAGRRAEFWVAPTDPDEDPLHVTWFLDDEKAGEGVRLAISIKKTGYHRIRAVASDGNASDEHAWTVTVAAAPAKPARPVDYYLVGLAGGVLVVMVAVALELRRMARSKKARQAKARARPRGADGRTKRRSPPEKRAKKAGPRSGRRSKRIL